MKKNLIRVIFAKLLSPSRKLPQEPSRLQKISTSVKETTSLLLKRILKTLFFLILISFFIFWSYLIVLDFKGQYLFSEDTTNTFLLIGFGISALCLVYFMNNVLERASKALSRMIDSIKTTRFYENIIYETSILLFEKFLLPNIDSIEPGLIGQHTDSFPETVLYKDTDFRNYAHVKQIEENYHALGKKISSSFLNLLVPLIVFVLELMFFVAIFLILLILTVIINLVTHNLYSDLFNKIFEVTAGWPMVIMMVSTPLSVFLLPKLFTHHSSVIVQRIEALRNELNQLSYEEDLVRRERDIDVQIDELEKDTGVYFSDSKERLQKIRTKLLDELEEIGDIQKEHVTPEFIEDTHSLIKEHKDEIAYAIQIVISEQEKKEKKKYLKDKIVDFVMGILVGVITAFLLQNFKSIPSLIILGTILGIIIFFVARQIVR